VTTYVLPRRLADRLGGALSGCRHAAEAMALATFLGRYWSVPTKLGDAFHVDRRKLADRPDLGLSEKRVRQALEALVTVGFLKRQPVKGSTHRMTDKGLRRKPALYRFGAEWWSIFKRACRKAAAAVREAVSKVASHQASARRPTAAQGQFSGRAQKDSVRSSQLYLGPQTKSGIPPQASVPDANLEAALDRLLRAAGIAGDGSGKGGAR
jgi:hypothetical protein